MAMRDHQDLDDMIIDVMSDATRIVESGSRDRLFVQEGQGQPFLSLIGLVCTIFSAFVGPSLIGLPLTNASFLRTLVYPCDGMCCCASCKWLGCSCQP